MKKSLLCFILLTLIAVPFSAHAISGREVVEEYMTHNEYETPTCLQEIVDIWNENDIIVNLPSKEPGSRMDETQIWDRYLITDQFEIIYTLRMDGQWDVMLLYLPKAWKPYRDAACFAIAHQLQIEQKEAVGFFEKLEYNQLAPSSKHTITEASIDVDAWRSISLTDFGDKICLHIWRYFE